MWSLVGRASTAWSVAGSPLTRGNGTHSANTLGRRRRVMSLPTLAIALLCAGVMGLLTLSVVAANSHIGPPDAPPNVMVEEVD